MDLKNLTSEELHSLIDSGEIDLSSLTKDELSIVFNKEMEELYVDDNHDLTLLHLCSATLLKFNRDENAEFWHKKYDIYEINNELLSKKHIKKMPDMRHISPRRASGIAVAVAIIAIILCVGVTAFFDPFSRFGLSLHDIFNKKGDVITGDNWQVGVSDGVMEFDSIEDLLSEIDFDVLIPGDMSNYHLQRLTLAKHAGHNLIQFDFSFDDEVNVEYDVRYGENLPDWLDEKYSIDSPVSVKSEWRGSNIYYIELESGCQANLYKGEYVYIFRAETREQIEELLNSLK